MGAIMIKCPVTGRNIPTGMDIDARRFLTMPVFFSRTYCMYCKSEHEWFAKNAWICESDVAVQAA